MKKLKIIIIIALSLIILYLSIRLVRKKEIIETTENKKEKYLMVYFTLNNPEKIEKNGERKKLIVGDIVKIGSSVVTDKNSMVGLTDNEKNIRIIIAKETTLVIDEIEKITVSLERGKTYNYIDKSIEFYQKTPTLTIGVRGTRFVVSAEENRSYVKIAKGKVEIKRNIVLPENIKEEIEILNENEMTAITKKENEEIQRQIGVNILKLPKITREQVSKNDKDIIELDNYEKIKPEEKTGKLKIENNSLSVYINNYKVGEGNIEVILNEGEYTIKIEDEKLIYEEKIQIEKDKTTIIKPVFRNKEIKKDNNLKPIEPSKKPLIEK